MKTNFLLTSVLSIVAFVFLFSSCETPENNVPTNSYIAADMLSDNIINAYIQANDELNFTNSYKQNLAQILTGQSINEIFIEPNNLVDNFELKINIFSAYRDYIYEIRTTNIIDNQEIDKKILVIIDYIDSLQNPEYSDKAADIRDYVSAYKFDKNIANYELTNLLFKIWDTDVISWVSTLNNAYDLYSETVDSISEDVFDQDKLEKFVYEPYKDKATLVNVYKLNMKQEAFEQKSNFISQTTELKSIFSSLRNIFLDISNNKDNKDLDSYLVDQIMNQLKNYNENSQN